MAIRDLCPDIATSTAIFKYYCLAVGPGPIFHYQFLKMWAQSNEDYPPYDLINAHTRFTNKTIMSYNKKLQEVGLLRVWRDRAGRNAKFNYDILPPAPIDKDFILKFFPEPTPYAPYPKEILDILAGKFKNTQEIEEFEFDKLRRSDKRFHQGTFKLKVPPGNPQGSVMEPSRFSTQGVVGSTGEPSRVPYGNPQGSVEEPSLFINKTTSSLVSKTTSSRDFDNTLESLSDIIAPFCKGMAVDEIKFSLTPPLKEAIGLTNDIASAFNLVVEKIEENKARIKKAEEPIGYLYSLVKNHGKWTTQKSKELVEYHKKSEEINREESMEKNKIHENWNRLNQKEKALHWYEAVKMRLIMKHKRTPSKLELNEAMQELENKGAYEGIDLRFPPANFR